MKKRIPMVGDMFMVTQTYMPENHAFFVTEMCENTPMNYREFDVIYVCDCHRFRRLVYSEKTFLQNNIKLMIGAEP